MYQQTENFTCGPASYLETFSQKKTKEIELELHKKGRIKPSRIFLGVSFLELNPELHLYIESYHLPESVIKLTYYKKIKNFNNEIKKYYSYLILKHKTHIHKINYSIEEFIALIDNFLQKEKKVLLLTNSLFWDEKGGVHWVTIKGINHNNEYIVGESYQGKDMVFSRKDMIKQLSLVKNKAKFDLQFVTN